jgi:hypothetical protein
MLSRFLLALVAGTAVLVAACSSSTSGGGASSSDNCGLPAGETEGIAMGCSSALTASSGPSTYQAALADPSLGCGMTVSAGTCGSYRTVMVFGSPSGGPATIYYFDLQSQALVAVVQRQDGGFGDTCLAGPSGFVEPCDQTCNFTGNTPTAACPDAAVQD